VALQATGPTHRFARLVNFADGMCYARRNWSRGVVSTLGQRAALGCYTTPGDANSSWPSRAALASRGAGAVG
jgi:hypothetical protein